MKYEGELFNFQGCDIERWEPIKNIQIDFQAKTRDGLFVDTEELHPVAKPRFFLGQKVTWDSIYGSFGHQVGEGVIEEVNAPLYLVTFNKEKDKMRWFREADLTNYIPVVLRWVL